MQITLSPEDRAEVFAKAYGTSAVASAADFDLVSTNRDIVYRKLTSGFMKSHAPGGPDKSENADALTDLEVVLRNLYDLIGFEDFQAEDEPELVAQVQAKEPEKLAKSIDASVFGDEFWDGPYNTAITTNTADVDETAASWQAAIDSITDAGYTPNLILLVNQARKVLKAAYVEDAQTNTLRDGNITEVDGVRVEFRNLKTGALADGDTVGIVGDFTQLAAVLKDELEVNTYEAASDLAARLKNKDYLFVGTRFGRTAADEDAFCLLNYAAA